MSDTTSSERLQAFLEGDLLRGYRPGQRLAEPPRLLRGRGDTADDERVDFVSLTLSPSGEAIEAVLTFAPPDSLTEAAAADGPDCAYSPELGCLAEVFPRDWRLPDLPHAMRPEWALEGIHSLSAGVTEPGMQLTARLLRYRPHSRAVILYEAKDGTGRVIAEAIGKVFRSLGKAERAWRLGSWIHEQTAASPVVPRHLALKEAVLVMEKSPGVDLESLLSQPDTPDALEAVRAAARAIRAFHAVPPKDVKDMKPSKDLRSIVELAKELETSSIRHPEVDRVVRTLELRHDAVARSPEIVLVHGSFKPSAVLYGHGRATIVDLDYAALGDPVVDIAYFTGHLRLMAASTGNDQLTTLADEFLAAYGPEAGAAGRDHRVRLFEATQLALGGLKSMVKAGDATQHGPGLRLLREAELRLG